MKWQLQIDVATDSSPSGLALAVHTPPAPSGGGAKPPEAKFGFFVELTDLFVEGLVPLDSLADDRYTYHENTREIIGLRSRKIYSLGQRVRVLVDRIDPVEKKIQFAVLEEKPVPKRKKR